MGDGILDFIDNNWGQLLGIGPANAAPGPATPPPMPPPTMAPPPMPPQVVDQSGKGDMASMAPNVGPQGPPPASFDQRFGQPQQDPNVLAALTAPGAPGGVPVRPGDQYTGVSPGDPGASGGSGGRPPMPPPGMAMPPGGPPMPPPSAMNQGGAPSPSGGGGLAGLLGIDPRVLQQAAAGVGKGLTAVGQQKPGTFGGTSFAAGMGGGLQGAVAQQDVQHAQARAQENDLFNQKSTAFKDWMAAEKLGDEKTMTAARAKYYDSLAAMRANGATGSNAWQNTPYGKAAALEKMLDNWENQQRLQLQAKWKATGSTPEEIKSDLADIAKKKEAERDRRSKALGINPNEYKKGTSKDESFDMEKLSPQQRAIMPDGAWYRYKAPGDPKADKDGYVYKQRDWLAQPPHPGWEPPGPQQPQPQSAPGGQPSPYQVEANDAAVMGS